MIQDEIGKIDSYLAVLEESESRLVAPDAIAQCHLTPEDIIDPMLLNMLTVELCQLTASGDVVGVRILLNGGADSNSRDYDGSTLLHIASMNGRLSVVNVLLEFGADATFVDRDGSTPLEVAEEYGYNEVAQALAGSLHAGTNVLPDSFAAHPSSSEVSPVSMQQPDFSSVPQPMLGSLIVIMVGLPGRGKTYVAQQICRYFQWNGLSCSIFSHQQCRRKVERAMLDRPSLEGTDASNPKYAAELELRVSAELAYDLTKYIGRTGGVAILDGTQTTHARRQSIFRAIKETKRINMTRVVFVEVVNNDEQQIHENILRAKEMFPSAPEDFVERYYEVIAQHKAVYKPLNAVTDCDMSYIHIEDATIFSLNMITGWMPSRLAFMLHNLSHTPTNLYLSRAGEYLDMLSGRIGGNSRLTARGRAYSKVLFNFFQQELSAPTSLTVMSSCAKRCVQTVHYFAEEMARQQQQQQPDRPTTAESSDADAKGAEEPRLRCRVSYFPTLDDINHGDCEGQLLSDVLKTMPSTLQAMKADPYYTAWPNGECIYQVFNARLEPHIHDIQASTTPILVVSHLNLLQGLYSYFVTDEENAVAPQNSYRTEIPFEYVIRIRIVGVNRVAEFINLTAEVDAMMLKEGEELSS